MRNALGFGIAVSSLLSLGCESAMAHRPALTTPAVAAQNPYRIELIGESGETLTTYSHRGRAYVLGQSGERYSIHVTNPTARRVEVVFSVDGLDAVDGRTADFRGKRGYVIPAYGEVTVEGFRTSTENVAAFRFSSVAASYAARKGQPRNVGVIGVAFFAEKSPPPQVMIPEPYPEPYYRYDDRDEEDYGGYAPSRDGAAKRAPAPRPPSPTRSATDKAAEAAPSTAPHGGAGSTTLDRDYSAESRQRPGLGTEFGESRWSRVSYTSFERATATPFTVVELRYNNASGLAALGIPVHPVPPSDDLYLRETASPFPDSSFSAPPPSYR